MLSDPRARAALSLNVDLAGLMVQEYDAKAAALVEEFRRYARWARQDAQRHIPLTLSVAKRKDMIGPQLHWRRMSKTRVTEAGAKPVYGTTYVGGLEGHRYNRAIFARIPEPYRREFCMYEDRAAQIRRGVSMVGDLIRASRLLFGLPGVSGVTSPSTEWSHHGPKRLWTQRPGCSKWTQAHNRSVRMKIAPMFRPKAMIPKFSGLFRNLFHGAPYSVEKPPRVITPVDVFRGLQL